MAKPVPCSTGIQPSRLRKYEILLEFGTGCADSLAAFKERLVYDLYLREHMKNRPGFAPSLDKWPALCVGNIFIPPAV